MTDLKRFQQPIFPTVEDVGPRPWGKEELLVLVPGEYMLKRLTIKAGSKGGLQYHRLKNECGLLLQGKMIVRFDDGKGSLTERVVLPGDCFHFPPGIVHQEEAVEDCVIIEGSTPHFNDRVRVEELYGISAKEGMPSTTIKEIIKK